MKARFARSFSDQFGRVFSIASRNAPAREIVLRGIEAVPQLLDLIDDRRISRHEAPAFMNSPARITRVGELANYLLQEIAWLHRRAMGRYQIENDERLIVQ